MVRGGHDEALSRSRRKIILTLGAAMNEAMTDREI